MRQFLPLGLIASLLAVSALPARAVTRAQMINRLEALGVRIVVQHTCGREQTVAPTTPITTESVYPDTQNTMMSYSMNPSPTKRFMLPKIAPPI